MTEQEVRKTGKPALVSTMAMEDVSRAYEKGETKGFMKILADQDSKQILGAWLLGHAGDEVIHCIIDFSCTPKHPMRSCNVQCTFIQPFQNLFRS
jgi:pyruvate/2-oxoglutarate dehydrogenase complex dihydrolipoamide dehydrogenase (E3) component